MAFGELTLRQPSSPRMPSSRLVDPSAGIVSYREPDLGQLFPTDINYAPNMIGVDFVSTDNIELQSLIAEHVAWVESTAIDFKQGAGIPATIRWLDAAGLVTAEFGYIASLGSGLVLEALNSLQMISPTTLGTVATPYAAVAVVGPGTVGGPVVTLRSTSAPSTADWVVCGAAGLQRIEGQVTNGTQTADFLLYCAVGSTSRVNLPDSTARFRMRDGGSGNSVDFIGGNLIFNGTNQSTIAPLGSYTDLGVRVVAAAAGTAHGSGYPWRHMTTNAGGTAYVTPTGFTFSSYVSTNAVTAQIRFPSYHGGMFTVNSIAAGVVEFGGNVTLS